MSTNKPAEQWEPANWLAELDDDEQITPVAHGPGEALDRPEMPDYQDRVRHHIEAREAAHHVVATLAELRRVLDLTQVEVAGHWGTTQPVVSRLEHAPERSETASLAAYVRALRGHLAIEAEIAGERYRYELV